jgi:hypothetical protein
MTNTTKAKPASKPNPGLLAFLASMDIAISKRLNVNSKLQSFSPTDKRRKAQEDKERMETPSEENSPRPAQKSPSPDRRFEGGFFEIRSPKTVTPKQMADVSRTPTRTSVNHLSSALQTNLQLTPGSRNSSIMNQSASRRLSNPKTPLMMLAVRRSMGSICKVRNVRTASKLLL